MNNIKEEEESDEEKIKIHEAEDTDNEDESDDSNDDNDVSVVIDKSIVKEQENSEEEDNHSNAKRPKRVSNDVSEGRTIFLKNVPFSVKNDELKKYMDQFGPVYYALVCIDPLTEYSRGTAFVKFQVG
jgi:nucleolar protein 4